MTTATTAHPIAGQPSLRLSNTHHGAPHFGQCEVCKTDPEATWILAEKIAYESVIPGKGLTRGWTLHNAISHFGHRECLLREHILHHSRRPAHDRSHPYLLAVGGTATVCRIPRDFSSDQWGTLQTALARHVHPRKHDAGVDTFRLYPDQIRFGIRWSEELAGSGGMSYLLLPLPGDTEEAIGKCRDHLRRTRDVVRLSVRRIKTWLPVPTLYSDGSPVFPEIEPLTA